MKFGAFDHIDRGNVSTSDQYEDRLRLAEAYDASGWIHAYHMAEHHGTPLGMAPSPPVFLASLAQPSISLPGVPAVASACRRPMRVCDR